MLLRAVAQSIEIVESVRDELLAARILSLRCGSEELYEILRLGRGLRPGFCRSGQEKFLELFLATSQGRLIGLKLMQALTANICRFLSGHAAVLVEIDRLVRHGLITFLRIAASTPIIDSVSGGAAGQMVALNCKSTPLN